jgi:hypothetical protein
MFFRSHFILRTLHFGDDYNLRQMLLFDPLIACFYNQAEVCILQLAQVAFEPRARAPLLVVSSLSSFLPNHVYQTSLTREEFPFWKISLPRLNDGPSCR